MSVDARLFLRGVEAVSAPPAFKDCARLIAARVEALDALKRELRGDVDQLYAEAESVIPRYRADKRLKADAAAELLARLP